MHFASTDPSKTVGRRSSKAPSIRCLHHYACGMSSSSSESDSDSEEAERLRRFSSIAVSGAHVAAAADSAVAAAAVRARRRRVVGGSTLGGALGEAGAGAAEDEQAAAAALQPFQKQTALLLHRYLDSVLEIRPSIEADACEEEEAEEEGRESFRVFSRVPPGAPVVLAGALPLSRLRSRADSALGCGRPASECAPRQPAVALRSAPRRAAAQARRQRQRGPGQGAPPRARGCGGGRSGGGGGGAHSRTRSRGLGRSRALQRQRAALAAGRAWRWRAERDCGCGGSSAQGQAQGEEARGRRGRAGRTSAERCRCHARQEEATRRTVDSLCQAWRLCQPRACAGREAVAEGEEETQQGGGSRSRSWTSAVVARRRVDCSADGVDGQSDARVTYTVCVNHSAGGQAILHRQIAPNTHGTSKNEGEARGGDSVRSTSCARRRARARPHAWPQGASAAPVLGAGGLRGAAQPNPRAQLLPSPARHQPASLPAPCSPARLLFRSCASLRCCCGRWCLAVALCRRRCQSG